MLRPFAVNSKNKIKPTIAYLPNWPLGKSTIFGEYAVLKTNNENIKIVLKITGKNNYSCYSGTFPKEIIFQFYSATYFLGDRIFIG